MMLEVRCHFPRPSGNRLQFLDLTVAQLLKSIHGPPRPRAPSYPCPSKYRVRSHLRPTMPGDEPAEHANSVCLPGGETGLIQASPTPAGNAVQLCTEPVLQLVLGKRYPAITDPASQLDAFVRHLFGEAFPPMLPYVLPQ